ncbi:cardiolipin synthase, partial [Polaribacter sp. DS7-9]|nr:cardiolipin synthase [Polaribacter sp. DS7-9]
LTQNKIEHFPFMPVVFSSLTGKMNYRNHRKIAIIDGKIGYVGGINISDVYLNNNGSKPYWRDTHLRLEGEAVKALQFHFLTTWNFVSGQTLQVKEAYFPVLHCDNTVAVQ